MTWHKPTQSFNSPDNFFNILWKNTLNGGEGILSNGYGEKIKTKINFSDKDREAFKIIELEVGTKWDKIQKYYALNQSEVPVPLTQGWDNRVVGQYMPSALSKTGMPTKLKTSVPYAVLTLQDAILLALRHNPNVKNEQIDRIITKYNNQLELDKLRYEWSGLSLNVD